MYIKDALSHPVFKLISDIVSEKGLEAYVIGGYVRDYLLKRPSKDIDVVVVGSGIELAKEVAARKGNVQVHVFKNFGTAMLHYNDLEIEFVGARKESYRYNSRKPLVENGTLKDDQQRRDFTINALAIALKKDEFGKFIDPFFGVKDLKNKIIRTPMDPDKTFSDDPLRMIRAIRFACQLNFDIFPETLASIKKNIHRIKILSNERIIEELNKIMLTKTPSKGFFLLDQTGLLPFILPEISNLKGVEIKKGKGHKDNFLHTMGVLDNLSKRSACLWLRWAALLHDIAKPQSKKFSEEHGWTFHGHDYLGEKMIPALFRRLKLPLNEKMKYVQKLVRLHLRPIALVEDIVSDSAIRRLLFEAGDDIDDLMLLCEADITSGMRHKVKQYLKNFSHVRKKMKEIEEKDAVRNFQPPVSGDMIMKTFAIKSCKEVGIIKNAIKEAILDGDIHNNIDEAYQFMLKKGESLGLQAVNPAKEK